MVQKVASKAKTVTAKWVVRVPGDEARVLVKAGEKVGVGQSLVEWVRYEKTTVGSVGLITAMKEGKRVETTEGLKGKKVATGEVILKGGGLFAVKVVAPVEGTIEGVDDFGNIVIRIDGQIRKEKTVSPVDAIVDRIEEDKIVLKFKAVELLGKGSEGGKAWGNCNLKVAHSLFEVKADMAGKILLTKDVSDTFLLKAEVVGVKGVVVVGPGDENDLKTTLPVVSIADGEIEKIGNRVNSDGEVRVLLNSKMGRVLVVVQ